MSTYTGNATIVNAESKRIYSTSTTSNFGTFGNPYYTPPAGTFARVRIRKFVTNLFTSLYIGHLDTVNQGTVRISGNISTDFPANKDSLVFNEFNMYPGDKLFSTTGSSVSGGVNWDIIIEVEEYNTP